MYGCIQFTIKMPKSVTYYQKLLSSAEESINQSCDKLRNITDGKDIKYEFNLESFIESISSLNLKSALEKIQEGIEVFMEIEKLLGIETKRRVYLEEMKKAYRGKEKKEELNKRVRFGGFRRKSKLKIQKTKMLEFDEATCSKFGEASIDHKEAVIEDEEMIEDVDD